MRLYLSTVAGVPQSRRTVTARARRQYSLLPDWKLSDWIHNQLLINSHCATPKISNFQKYCCIFIFVFCTQHLLLFFLLLKYNIEFSTHLHILRRSLYNLKCTRKHRSHKHQEIYLCILKIALKKLRFLSMSTEK